MFKDLVVLELAAVLAGPSVGMFFAELGAQVIKVENPHRGGDVTRSWKLAQENPDTDLSAYYLSVNWGKKSLALDLKSEEGRELIYRLIPKVDVVLVSYKPGDAEKLGMDYETLSGLNAKLIYAELNAYGSADPRPGFDAIIQAEAGFTYMNGTTDGPPVKMPVALMDLLAAHQLKEGVLVALIHRMQTGKGQKVSTSLLASGVASLANQASNYLNAGKIPQRMGSAHPNIVPYGTIFYTRDQKPVVLAVGNNVQFARLCVVLERPDLAEHPDYQSNPGRVAARETLDTELQAAFDQFDREPLLAEFHRLKVPAGAVLNLSEVFEQPEAKRLMLNSGEAKGVRTFAVDFGEPTPGTPPRMGADTQQVLQAFLNLTEEELEKLHEQGVIAHSKSIT